MEEKRNEEDLPFRLEQLDWELSAPQEGTLACLKGLEGDILVLGAGGKMGLHMCVTLKRALDALGQGNRVYAASRFQTLNSREAYEENGIEVLAGDFRDKDFVAGLPRCPTVYYLVGAKFGTSNNPELLRQINVEVAKDLGEAFKDSRIVAFSTGCVYSYVTPDSGGSTEESETDPVGEYAQSCLGRERAFEAVSKAYGTPVVLIRLNYSVEFRYGVLVDIGQKVLAEKPVDITMGYVNVIWQPDAVNQIIQCLKLAGSPAVPINITGPEVLGVKDLALRFGKTFGKTPTFTGEPAETMWLSNAAKSHSLLGKPSVSVDRMVEWIARYLEQGGPTHGKPTGFEKRDGKF